MHPQNQLWSNILPFHFRPPFLPPRANRFTLHREPVDFIPTTPFSVDLYFLHFFRIIFNFLNFFCCFFLLFFCCFVFLFPRARNDERHRVELSRKSYCQENRQSVRERTTPSSYRAAIVRGGWRTPRMERSLCAHRSHIIV